MNAIGTITDIPSLSGIISEVGVLTGSLSPVGGITGAISRDILPAVYTGEYEVIPHPYDDQVLETQDKFMEHDVTVQKVPYSEVTNPSGGFTVNIAYIL